jgi:hypothetical protein
MPQRVCDQAALGPRRGEVEHLPQRGPVAKQPALEQHIEEPSQVLGGGDERAGVGERRVDAGEIDRPASSSP